MVEELRDRDRGNGADPRAAREPEELGREPEHAGDRKVGDRTPGEAATGPREPQEPRTTHVEEGREGAGFLGRARKAWERIRYRR